MKTRFYFLFCILFVSVLQLDLQAHGLRIFAAPQGDKINGYAYFSKGVKGKNLKVVIFSEDGKKAGETRTDSKGEFSFVPKIKSGYRFVINIGDGHKAEYFVNEKSLPGGLQKGQKTISEKNNSNIENQQSCSLNENQLRKIVSEEVSKQLFPVKQQIDQQQSTTRFRDILGGIGYIFGIAGLVSFYLALKKSK